jgi:hypothetical protein
MPRRSSGRSSNAPGIPAVRLTTTIHCACVGVVELADGRSVMLS